MGRISSLRLGWALGPAGATEEVGTRSPTDRTLPRALVLPSTLRWDGLSPTPCPLEPGFPFPISPSFRPPLVCIARLRPDGKIPKDV